MNQHQPCNTLFFLLPQHLIWLLEFHALNVGKYPVLLEFTFFNFNQFPVQEMQISKQISIKWLFKNIPPL